MKIIDSVLQKTTKKPIITIILVIIISAALFPGVLRLEQDNDFHGYLDPDADVPVKLDYMEAKFHCGTSTLFIAVEDENIYNTEVLEYVYEIHKAMEDYSEEDIKEVTSVINVKDITGEDKKLETYTFIKEDEQGNKLIPKTEKELSELKQNIESNDKYKAYIVSNTENENGLPKAWNILVEMEEKDVYDDIVIDIEKIVNNIVESHNHKYETYLSGEAYTLKEMNVESRKDLFIQVALVVLVICIVYLLNFRRATGVVFPLITNIIGALWTYSIIGYAGVKLSIIGLLLIPLLIAVGSSYAIHSLNQYYKESHTFTQKNKKKQIAQSMSHILKTITLAGITTMISLSSLVTSSITHLRTFGIFAGIGVGISIILSITLLPSMISLIKIPKYKKSKSFDSTWFDRGIEKVIMFTIKRKFVVFFVGMFIIAISIVGIFFVSTDSSSGDFFVEEHKVRDLLDYFGDNFDGVSTMDVVIDANPFGEYSIRNEIKKIKEKRSEDSVDVEEIIDNANEEKSTEKQTNENEYNATHNDTNKKTNEKETTNEAKDTSNDENLLENAFSEDVLSDEEETEDVSSEELEDAFSEDVLSDEGKKEDESSQDLGDPFSEDVLSDEEETGDVLQTDEEDFIDSSEIEIDYDVNYALNSDLLHKVEKLMEYAETLEGIGRCYSFVDIQKRFNYAMNNNDLEYEKIPDSTKKIIDYTQLFSGDDDNNDGLPDVFENFVDPSYNKLRITMKLKNIGDRLINSGDFSRIKKKLTRYIEKNFNTVKAEDFKDGDEKNGNSKNNKVSNDENDKINYFISGGGILFLHIQRKIVKGQLVSIIFSLIVLVIITTILFNSFKTGLLSLIPLSTAVIINFGIMGFSGIVLNIGTSLITAFAIGIGIDDTIHFMLNLRKYMKQHKKESIETVIHNTLTYTSKPITFTSLALIFGFIVVITSTFMPIRNFSILLTLTMVNATLATLMFLPSIILIFPKLAKIKKPKPLGKFNRHRIR